MNTWLLPTSVEISGESFDIRSDFRAILDILDALDNQDLNSVEKAIVTIEIFYQDYEKIPIESMQEACDKAMEFINFMGEENTKPVKLMDWQQDANILIPAINKVLGKEIRFRTLHALVDVHGRIHGNWREPFLTGAGNPAEKGKQKETG